MQILFLNINESIQTMLLNGLMLNVAPDFTRFFLQISIYFDRIIEIYNNKQTTM